MTQGCSVACVKNTADDQRNMPLEKLYGQTFLAIRLLDRPWLSIVKLIAIKVP